MGSLPLMTLIPNSHTSLAYEPVYDNKGRSKDDETLIATNVSASKPGSLSLSNRSLKGKLRVASRQQDVLSTEHLRSSESQIDILSNDGVNMFSETKQHMRQLETIYSNADKYEPYIFNNYEVLKRPLDS